MSDIVSIIDDLTEPSKSDFIDIMYLHKKKMFTKMWVKQKRVVTWYER